MTDYVKAVNFATKDALASGEALKLIKGTELNTEFDLIATASATKYDSGDIASQSEAEGLSSSTKLMTPERVNDVLAENGSMLQDIQALADPNADQLLGWDDSANAVVGFTMGDSLEFSGTTINMKTAVAGAGLAISSGLMSVGGGSGITANANDVALTNAAASSTNPVDIASGTVSLDVESLTTIEGSALNATDTFYVEDGGVSKGVEVQAMGLRVQTGQGSQTVAASDMNTIMEFTGTSTLTLPVNSGVDLPIGVPIILNMKHATQELTVTAASSVTLVSVFHPAGTSAASDTVLAGGSALLYKTAANVWCLAGDTAT